jgi:hypothetical protein
VHPATQASPVQDSDVAGLLVKTPQLLASVTVLVLVHEDEQADHVPVCQLGVQLPPLIATVASVNVPELVVVEAKSYTPEVKVHVPEAGACIGIVWDIEGESHPVDILFGLVQPTHMHPPPIVSSINTPQLPEASVVVYVTWNVDPGSAVAGTVLMNVAAKAIFNNRIAITINSIIFFI